MPAENHPWSDAPLEVPAPSARERTAGTDATAAGLALLEAHASVVSVLARRSPADFRPVPSWVADRAAEVRAAFTTSEGLPPSLVAELAPLVAPRLERVVDHLRRRLGRERQLLPLPRLREMDPACVRRNARLPGKTLIEKAGPRQEVLGVVRVPRFDTMENRVLVATARGLAARAAVELRRVHSAGDPRARVLRRLQRAAADVLARPELEGVGAPRAGERPSNALVGDADYRAVWRAGLLVRREEERFVDEWRALPAVWLELVLLATWAALEGAGEALATWVRVADGRAGGLRVETGAPRRWIAASGEEAVVTTVVPDSAGEAVRVRRITTGPDGEHVEDAVVPAALWIGPTDDEEQGVLGAPVAAPGRARAAALVARAAPWCAAGGAGANGASAAETGPAGSGRDAANPAHAARFAAPADAAVDDLLGVCALDAHVVVAGVTGTRDAGPFAAAHVVVPGEAPMEAFGRAATWLPTVAGPDALFGVRAEEGGALLSEFRGRHDTAVVVPDTLDEVGVRSLRARLGRAWFVWSPVAAALAAAEERPDVFHVQSAHRHVLVVVATDAALDVAVLEETEDTGRKRRPGRLWVRSAPRGGGAEGREASRFTASESARGAWLREPDATAGWVVEGERARRVGVPAAPSLVERAAERAARWSGPKPDLLLAVGLDDADARALGERTGLPMVTLDATALARGARVFLVRHRAGLATWKDRLPALAFDVVRDRARVPIELVKRGELVAPGDSVDFSTKETFLLREGRASFAFRIQRDGRPADYAIVLEGGAFPLAKPASVRIALRYVYGLHGMEGAVEPVGPAPFSRVPFRVEVAERSSSATEPTTPGGALRGGSAPPPQEAEERVDTGMLNRAPARRAREELAPGAEKALRDAVRALEEAIKKLPPKLRKEAEGQAGKVDKELSGAIRAVADAAKVQAGAGPAPGNLREFLEREAAPLLDWLAGAKASGRGKPPLLGRDARLGAVRARAELAVRGNGEFGGFARNELNTRGLPAKEAFYALGRVVDGDAEAFRALCALPTEPALHGDWAAALRVALDARPDLAGSADAGALLDRVVQQLDAIAARPDPSKDAVRNHADLVPRLCHARPVQLAPDAPRVRTAVERLEAVRAQLPEAVRRHGGRASTNADDEPLAVAIAYLRGDYTAIPEHR